MALFSLVRKKKFEEISILLKTRPDVDPNKRNDKGQTPLYWACEFADSKITDILIEYGANVNVEEENGFTPLHLASFLGNEKVVNSLLGAKAQVNRGNKTGSTPLHLAAKNGHSKVVAALLGNGASPTITDENGKVPIHYTKDPLCKKLLGLPSPSSGASVQKLQKDVAVLKRLVKALQEKAQKEAKAKVEAQQALIHTVCLKCKEKPRDTAIVPCMHFLYCWDCVGAVDNCHSCGGEIEGVMQLRTTESEDSI